MPPTKLVDGRVAETLSNTLSETTLLLGNDGIRECDETPYIEGELTYKNDDGHEGYTDFKDLPPLRRPSVCVFLRPGVQFQSD